MKDDEVRQVCTGVLAMAGYIKFLEKENERIRLECVATLTDVGIPMLVGSDPCAPGEVAAAIRRLAALAPVSASPAKNEATESPWVSVTERLPKEGVPVLVCYDGTGESSHRADIASLVLGRESALDDKWENDNWHRNVPVGTFSFWMPLPAAPRPASPEEKP